MSSKPSQVVSSKQAFPTVTRGEVELWAPSQAFQVGQIITLSGGGEWSKYGDGVDPRLDETYDDSIRYEEIPAPMFVVTGVSENGRVQARECSTGDIHDHRR